MWYSSLSTGAYDSPDGPPPASGPSHMHNCAQPGVSFMPPMDELYCGQMASSFGGGFTLQHGSPGTSQFFGPGPGGAGGGSGTGRHWATHGVQAPMDASVSGQPPLMAAQTQMGGQGNGHGYGYGYGHGHGVVDPDTIAMWSTAPTGFEYVVFLSSSSYHFILSSASIYPLSSVCRFIRYPFVADDRIQADPCAFALSGSMTGGRISRTSL